MTKDEALLSIARCEDLIKGFGAPDPDLLREARGIVASLLSGPLQDSYFREKVSNFKRWAEDGFSVRKFQQYAGGLQQVKSSALGQLWTAKSLIEEHWPK